MSLIINEECIACGACEPECPVSAISEGDPIYIINTDVCVECKGYHDSPQCVDICPVEACVPLED